MQTPDHAFHVVDNEITIDFDVPLAASGADEVLTELLSHHALEIIRDRKDRGQPLEGIPVARISAGRGERKAEIAVLDLDQPDSPIEIDLPELVPVRLSAGYDLLARYGESTGGESVPLAERRADELPPVSEEVRLTAGLAAGLRSLGVDPETMSMTDLATGLLQLTGYTLNSRDNGSYMAIGHGATTLVSVVAHEPGEHPELAEAAVDSFLIAKASARADRGLLLTDKYGPYMIYRKERADSDVLFVVRERLQAFVDAIAVS